MPAFFRNSASAGPATPPPTMITWRDRPLDTVRLLARTAPRPPNVQLHPTGRARRGRLGPSGSLSTGAVGCSGGFGVCTAPGDGRILGIGDHSSNNGTGRQPLESATDEPTPRQLERDWHVDEGAEPGRGTEGK